MHTKRVIPCLDVKDGRVVKGVNFVNFRDAGDPSEVASAYGDQVGGQTAGNSRELSVGILLCGCAEISGDSGHSLFGYGG